jgi:FkbM family methyltransferase
VVKFVSPSTLTVENVTLYLNRNDAVLNALLLLGLFEVMETILFKRLLKPGMVFLDVGANIGYYSALASSLVGKEGTVISLEPEINNFALLQKTLNANQGPDYRLFNIAAASEDATAQFYVSEENCGDNRLAGNVRPQGGLEWRTVTVSCRRIDDLIRENNLPLPDLIKVDVQGFEAEVLKGCRELFEKKARFVMMIEFWPEGLKAAGSDPISFLREIRQLGFGVQYITLKGKIENLDDDQKLVDVFTGRAYTNLFCSR